MQLAVDVAGFDAGEADLLRRAMGVEALHREDGASCEDRLYDGMRDAARHHR